MRLLAIAVLGVVALAAVALQGTLRDTVLRSTNEDEAGVVTAAVVALGNEDERDLEGYNDSPDDSYPSKDIYDSHDGYGPHDSYEDYSDKDYAFLVSHIKTHGDHHGSDSGYGHEYTSYCITADDGVKKGALVGFKKCDFKHGPRKQLWYLDDEGRIHSKLDPHRCLIVDNGTHVTKGSRIRIQDCDKYTKYNKFDHNGGTDKLKVKAKSSYCVTNSGSQADPTDFMNTQKCKDRYKFMFTYKVYERKHYSDDYSHYDSSGHSKYSPDHSKYYDSPSKDHYGSPDYSPDHKYPSPSKDHHYYPSKDHYDSSDDYHSFDYSYKDYKYAYLVSNARKHGHHYGDDYCITADDGVKKGALVGFKKCDFKHGPRKQLWYLDSDGKIHSKLDPHRCLIVDNGTHVTKGSRIRIADCDKHTYLTKFDHNGGTDKLKVKKHSKYCVTNSGAHPDPTDFMNTQLCKDKYKFKFTYKVYEGKHYSDDYSSGSKYPDHYDSSDNSKYSPDHSKYYDSPSKDHYYSPDYPSKDHYYPSEEKPYSDDYKHPKKKPYYDLPVYHPPKKHHGKPPHPYHSPDPHYDSPEEMPYSPDHYYEHPKKKPHHPQKKPHYTKKKPHYISPDHEYPGDDYGYGYSPEEMLYSPDHKYPKKKPHYSPDYKHPKKKPSPDYRKHDFAVIKHPVGYNHKKKKNYGCLVVNSGNKYDGEELFIGKCQYAHGWKYDHYGRLHSEIDYGYCMQPEYGIWPKQGTALRLYKCAVDNDMQLFERHNGHLKLKGYKLCLSFPDDAARVGSPVVLWNCDDATTAWVGLDQIF